MKKLLFLLSFFGLVNLATAEEITGRAVYYKGTSQVPTVKYEYTFDSSLCELGDNPTLQELWNRLPEKKAGGAFARGCKTWLARNGRRGSPEWKHIGRIFNSSKPIARKFLEKYVQEKALQNQEQLASTE